MSQAEKNRSLLLNDCFFCHDLSVQIDINEPRSWAVSTRDELQGCKTMIAKLESEPRQMAIDTVRHYHNDYLTTLFFVSFSCSFYVLLV